MAQNYHLIVIGAGSGGLVAAAGAAALGAKVALIEKFKMGGDCLNTGCVPSKSILRAAKLAHDAKTASRFGLGAFRPAVELDRVMASVREVQEKIAPHDSPERFRGLGVTVRFGSYRFLSRHEITDGNEVLSARRFVIATGSSPRVPEIPGLNEVPFLTSDTVWGLTRLPERLLVLGGGPIGVEMAQAFARLGARVSLVEKNPSLLPREDTEVSRLLVKIFRAEGIDVLPSTTLREFRKGAKGFELIASHPIEGEMTLSFDTLLVAVGRSPHVKGLDLTKAGVDASEEGIPVNEKLQTSSPHIYACGDVTGPYRFTHTADFQARLILRNALFPGSARIDYRTVPWCTFTDPEVARVGLNEREASRSHIPYEVYAYPMDELDRALCDREEKGFIKILVKKGSDRILGVTLVGPHAGEVIHEAVLAMHQGIGLKKIASMIHVYPTLSEIVKRAADAHQASRLTPRLKRWLRRYFSWRFG